jgi:predicted transcriptional regulator
MIRGESLKTQIFFIIKSNPGILRTEVRDKLELPNNVVTPAIKELIDAEMVVEGNTRLSKTTNRPGKELFVAEDWRRELDAQNRIFE